MEDANELIQLAREAGLIDHKLNYLYPHAKKCVTRADVEKSHFGRDQQVVFKMDNIYGMIVLMAIGLGGATFIAVVELIVYKVA